MKKLLLSSFYLLVWLYSFASNAFETNAKFAAVMDYDTGVILFEKNSDEKMIPSSMTKLMTAYIVFERLQNNILKLDDEFTVSKKAWKMGGSKMFLRHTERVSIDELLNGIIIQSGNDACIAVAEGIASDEESFAKLMNQTAEKIGLKNSHFVNATGWPDEGHYMSARDLAILSQQVIKKFPEYYHYFSKAEYKYSNIIQKNRNMLLFMDIGVDGLKTGHTEDAGYGMVASAKRGDSRIIAVVNGLDSEIGRADEAERLINYGFRYFERKTLFKSGQVVGDVNVWQGKEKSVPVAVKDDITLMVPKLSVNEIDVDVTYNSPIVTPIKKGDEVGEIVIKIPNTDNYKYKLVASTDVKKASSFKIFISNMMKYFKG